MGADESLGLTFVDDSEANTAQVSYFKRFGGPPDGKEHFLFFVFCPDRSLCEPLKELLGLRFLHGEAPSTGLSEQTTFLSCFSTMTKKTRFFGSVIGDAGWHHQVL